MIIVSDASVISSDFSDWSNQCNPITSVLTFSREVCRFTLYILFVGWHYIKVEYVWVRKQQLASKHQVSDSTTVQTLDLGLYHVCSGMCEGRGHVIAWGPNWQLHRSGTLVFVGLCRSIVSVIPIKLHSWQSIHAQVLMASVCLSQS